MHIMLSRTILTSKTKHMQEISKPQLTRETSSRWLSTASSTPDTLVSFSKCWARSWLKS